MKMILEMETGKNSSETQEIKKSRLFYLTGFKFEIRRNYKYVK